MPVSRAIQHESLDFDALMKTLTDSFNVLADEVQILSDRKTILEHKLSFAREQVRLFMACFFAFKDIFKTALYDEQHSSRSGVANATETDKHHVS